MNSRSAAVPAVNSPQQKGRKSTQRERLLTGMTAVASRDGYGAASVTAVIAQAGVSRPTFYEYFTDRDACFVAALREAQARLATHVQDALRSGPPERAVHATVEALVTFAGSSTVQAQFLMSEAMAAGWGALDARDEGIAQIARMIEDAYEHLPARMPFPDLPPTVLIGGVYRLLSARLRRGDPALPGLLDDLLEWAQSYSRPAGEHRWRSITPSVVTSLTLDAAVTVPVTLPDAPEGASKRFLAETQRQRILLAAAQLAQDKGYNASTVQDILRVSGVDRRSFYHLFADKQEAFMAVHELGVQYVLSVTADAFFSGTHWPERIWRAGRALTGFLNANPMFAHVGFVQAYAVGPAAVQRVEDSHNAFTIFLQEGYRYRPRVGTPSRLALEAIISTIFEVIYQQARKPSRRPIGGLLANMAHVTLTPFLGVSETNEFIDGEVNG